MTAHRSPRWSHPGSWWRARQQLTDRFTVNTRPPLLQLMKAAAAAILTWFICSLIFPAQPPIFGAIAALVVMQDNVDQSLTRGIERVAGVVVGVAVALGAAALFGAQTWLFIAAIIVSLCVGWLLRMSQSSTTQIAISALLMIALGGLQLDYGFERLVETAIGAAIGVLLNALIVAPVRTSSVRVTITQLSLHTSEALIRLAEALEAPRDEAWLGDMLDRARELNDERSEAHRLLRQARESLRLNPRGRHYRVNLAADDELFLRLQPIVTQVIGMSRTLYDLYEVDVVEDPAVLGMAEEIRRAAHDLLLLVTPNAQWSPGTEPPALTAPYRIPQANPDHWVLIGSLMADLGRVRGRITGDLE